MAIFLVWASGLLATVYGFGEMRCGSPQHPKACVPGIETASGELTDASEPQFAVPMPEKTRVRPKWISLRVKDGPCRKIRLVDKKHWRFIRRGGFDLNSKAIHVLTGRWPKRSWRAKVFVCSFADVSDLPIQAIL